MWESKFLCGYECHFLDVVGGGCAKWDVCENSLWKQSSTTIYRRHCCLQTLFLLFKYVMSETKESCYKNQCASAGTLISSIATDFFTDTAAILN